MDFPNPYLLSHHSTEASMLLMMNTTNDFSKNSILDVRLGSEYAFNFTTHAILQTRKTYNRKFVPLFSVLQARK